MTKPMSRMLLYVGLFFALVFGWYAIKKGFIIWTMSRFKMPPVTVSSVVAVQKQWRDYVEAVGSFVAENGVDLSSEVGGIIQSIHMQSDQFVKKGDLIFELDTTIEKASLKDKKARLKLAGINYERDKKLFAKNVLSQSTLDTHLSELEVAEAAVELVEAQIKQKTITAPFDGRVGIRQVNLGQYVSPGTMLVTLQSLNPLLVEFSLPENYLPNLYFGEPIEAIVTFGQGKTVLGKVTAINAKVDQVTRNIQVQATVPNPSYSLYPGMYALVKVWFNATGLKVIVPQTSVSYSLSGDYVFLIKKEGDKKAPTLHVARQYIKIGERRDAEVAVMSGLKAGDEIVNSGQLKLQNGASVVINNKVQ